MGWNKRKAICGVILAAGVLLTAAGLLRGEAAEVYQKAVRICLECIGIG